MVDENEKCNCDSNDSPSSAPFDAYVILDFEATCERGRRIPEPEIIEFPFVIVDSQLGKPVTEFQRYVRPGVNPHLSKFCVELTGITQSAVDQANSFPHVWGEVLSFLRQCHLERDTEGVQAVLDDANVSSQQSPSSGRRYCIVCCGDWDLQTMFPLQLELSRRLLENDATSKSHMKGDTFRSSARTSHLKANTLRTNHFYRTAVSEGYSATSDQLNTLNLVPPSWFHWCNIKHFVSKESTRISLRNKLQVAIPRHIKGMIELLQLFNLPLIGREHSGIDDCRNIASVVCELLKHHCHPLPTAFRDTSLDTPLVIYSPFSFSIPSQTVHPKEREVLRPRREESHPYTDPNSSIFRNVTLPILPQSSSEGLWKPSLWPPSSLDSFTRKQNVGMKVEKQIKPSADSCGAAHIWIKNKEHESGCMKGKNKSSLPQNYSYLSQFGNFEVDYASKTNVDRDSFSTLAPSSSAALLNGCSSKLSASSSSSLVAYPSLLCSSLDVCTEWEVVNQAVEMYTSIFLQESESKKSSRSPSVIHLSKTLSYILRHGALKKGVPMSINGFVQLEHLLNAPVHLRGIHSFAETVVNIAQLVKNCPKQRFILGILKNVVSSKTDECSCKSDKKQTVCSEECKESLTPPPLCIAATQGHSIPGVQALLKRIMRAEEAPIAVHGTDICAWRVICEDGYLSPMNRTHIHFAKGLPSQNGVRSGMRANSTVFIYLNVPKVLETDSNVVLLESLNGVLLTSGEGDTRRLPLRFILKAVDRQGNVLLANN